MGSNVSRSELEWRGHDFKSAAHVATRMAEEIFDQMGRFKHITKAKRSCFIFQLFKL
jgi:hypothetical protein